jgi:hypothetical protein
MHNTPSEASILRSLLEKEIAAHKATKAKLAKAFELVELVAEQQLYPDDWWKRELEKLNHEQAT